MFIFLRIAQMLQTMAKIVKEQVYHTVTYYALGTILIFVPKF